MASSQDNELNGLCSKAAREFVAGETSSIEITKKVVGADGDVQIVTEHISSFDFYSCEEAIKRLNDYLDAELQPGERDDVLKHLKICAPCLERFHFEKSLLMSMREKIHKKMAPLKLKERLSSLMKSGDQ